jgi:hypothetical protein
MLGKLLSILLLVFSVAVYLFFNVPENSKLTQNINFKRKFIYLDAFAFRSILGTNDDNLVNDGNAINGFLNASRGELKFEKDIDSIQTRDSKLSTILSTKADAKMSTMEPQPPDYERKEEKRSTECWKIDITDHGGEIVSRDLERNTEITYRRKGGRFIFPMSQACLLEKSCREDIIPLLNKVADFGIGSMEPIKHI